MGPQSSMPGTSKGRSCNVCECTAMPPCLWQLLPPMTNHYPTTAKQSSSTDTSTGAHQSTHLPHPLDLTCPIYSRPLSTHHLHRLTLNHQASNSTTQVSCHLPEEDPTALRDGSDQMHRSPSASPDTRHSAPPAASTRTPLAWLTKGAPAGSSDLISGAGVLHGSRAARKPASADKGCHCRTSLSSPPVYRRPSGPMTAAWIFSPACAAFTCMHAHAGNAHDLVLLAAQAC